MALHCAGRACLDLTRRFPLIADTLARLRLRSRSCIIDGEAVSCDDNGVASFDLVRHHRANDKILLYAFDLIELNGDDLRQFKTRSSSIGRRPMGLSFRLRMAKCIAQCLNVEHESHHTTSKLCILRFHPIK